MSQTNKTCIVYVVGAEEEKPDVAVTSDKSNVTESTGSEIKMPKIVNKFPSGGVGRQTTLLVLGALLVVLGGVASGWLLSGGVQGSGSSTADLDVAPGAKQTAMEAGLEDESTFPDEAEGVLNQGGIEGEGTHYLDRNAGPDKQVYLTSTVIDLESFVGKKVHVWGETIAAQHAPWLMDVGKLKVVQE